MVVRLVEMITKPGQAESICNLLEVVLTPLARRYPGFCDALCLVLRLEPRILVVFTEWRSEADANRFYQHAFPMIASMLHPFVDQLAIREFESRVAVTAAAARAG